MNSSEKGRRAEEEAARFLKSQGYAIVERNFRWKGGEIDIIAKKGETLVFVEVRSRARPDFGTAAQTIGSSKIKKIKTAALLYLQNKNLDCPIRFDVIAFDGEKMERLENAFPF